MSHTKAVRTRIMEEVKRRLELLAGVGVVVLPGFDGEADARTMSAQVQSGKAAMAITSGHDTPVVLESGQRAFSTETWWFDVNVLIVLPSPTTPEGTLAAGPWASYDDMATYFHGLVQGVYDDEDIYENGGEWFEVTLPAASEDPPPVALAINTVCLGGGGVVIDEGNTDLPATESGFRVTYRTVRGKFGSVVA